VTYAAEPYAQFVDDLLTALTGGVSREQFVFLPEDGPYRLSPPGPLIPSTLRVFGQAGGAFARFQADRDFTLDGDLIRWKAQADGTPAPDAVWPDPGTPFYANYEAFAPAGAVPPLTDRNPGSVTRLLSESFAREYAVLSRQLESVYRAGFLETATGRDLEQVVALLGLTRFTRAFAVGTVVFSRSTPAPADVFIPAGTRLSTAEPPAVVFETTEDETLHRGSLSAEAPVRATVSDAVGVVPARAIRVIHRPILGVESVENPQTTALSGTDEGDEALRARARRALEGAGKATMGALLGALATLPGVREKDVGIDEDPLSRPGVLTLRVAAPLSDEGAREAIALIEATRPAGVRVLHDLDNPTPPAELTPGPNPDDDTAAPPDAAPPTAGLFLPVAAKAILLPASGALSPQDRAALKRQGEDAIRAVVGEAGIGEILVYNRLVAALMAIDGVTDATLELYPNLDGQLPPSHRNLVPPKTLRPTVDPQHGGLVQVEIGGQLVALDVTVGIALQAEGALGDQAVDLANARIQVAGQLRDAVGSLTALSVATLRGAIVPRETFTITSLAFTMEYVQAGVRINKLFTEADPAVPVSPLQRLWVRTVRLAGGET
jgi:hypothetical protein